MSTRTDPAATLPAALMAEIVDCGFYPSVVQQALAGAVGGHPIRAHLVHHEATFAGHEVHRHITVLVLLDRALIICHADEEPHGNAIVTAELVKLATVSSVVLTQSVSNPASASAGLAEVWLTVVWGATRRLDMGPAACEDPACTADHGYAGVSTSDDYVVRMSRDADGVEQMSKLVAFGERLQEASA